MGLRQVDYHQQELTATTKMLKSLLILLVSTRLLVESAVSQGPCSDRGTETTEESWACSNGDSTCTKIVNTCSSDGFGTEVSGRTGYLSNGLSSAVGPGWDCRDKCRDCRFSCSGSQSRTKGIGRPSFGSGSSSGSGSRPSGGSRNCDYTCERNGGCKVTYVGPPRAGRTHGSCSPRDFGGSCSGTPRECQDCNQAINC